VQTSTGLGCDWLFETADATLRGISRNLWSCVYVRNRRAPLLYIAPAVARETQRPYSSACNCTRRNRSGLPSRCASPRADECLLAPRSTSLRPEDARLDARRSASLSLSLSLSLSVKSAPDRDRPTVDWRKRRPRSRLEPGRSFVRRDYIGNDYQSSHCVEINRAIVFFTIRAISFMGPLKLISARLFRYAN